MRNGMALIQELDSAPSPDGPVAQEASYNTALLHASVDLEDKGSKKVQSDAVIVPRIEGDIAPRFRHGSNDIEGLVAVEWSDLDGHNVFNFCELAPTSVGEYAATHGRLQIKTNQRQNFRHSSAGSREGYLIRIFHRGQAQEACAISQIVEQRCLAERLRGLSADTSDAD